MIDILVKPKNALVKQYTKLLEMEGAELEIRPEALHAIARKALERKTGARGPVSYTHLQPVFSPETGFISIQSIGQRSRHRSQPVQQELMTVCIIFPVPTMASTGQV